LHLLSQLGKVEHEFANEVIVIGVHSPKFPAEHDDENVRQAVRRYGITHPVVNDPQLRLWRQYGVNAWPTIAILDPRGYVVGAQAGEVPADRLAAVLRQLIREYDAQGLIDRQPRDWLQPEPQPDSLLAFPGKVFFDSVHQRLFIADTGHHRIVVTDPTGHVQQMIGSGIAGFNDGTVETAAFSHPYGLVVQDQTLYVADTGNHAIRRVDLDHGTVETIAGTGQLGFTYASAGPARERDLRSPWALALDGTTLYIAMAGMHQIWALDLVSGMLRPYAGSGMEGIQGGPLERAWFAQPSGLALGNDVLYVADSEASAIRAVDLPRVGKAPRDLLVHRLVGVGLFDFGDRDGTGDAVRLQHPLDVAWQAGTLYVADSYNNKIKRLDPITRECRSWLGTGQPGLQDGPADNATFWEPGGLAVGNGVLYIADTNNHAIRTVHLQTGIVQTLVLR